MHKYTPGWVGHSPAVLQFHPFLPSMHNDIYGPACLASETQEGAMLFVVTVSFARLSRNHSIRSQVKGCHPPTWPAPPLQALFHTQSSTLVTVSCNEPRMNVGEFVKIPSPAPCSTPRLQIPPLPIHHEHAKISVKAPGRK